MALLCSMTTQEGLGFVMRSSKRMRLLCLSV